MSFKMTLNMPPLNMSSSEILLSLVAMNLQDVINEELFLNFIHALEFESKVLSSCRR